MIFIKDGRVEYSDDRYQETCLSCGALGYGNMTCAPCVRQWTRFGIDQNRVDELLKAIGDKPPVAPFGTKLH